MYLTCQKIGGAIKGTNIYTKLAKIGSAIAPPAPPLAATLTLIIFYIERLKILYCRGILTFV